VQEQKIAGDAPKVEFLDITVDMKILQSVATVAGTIDTGRDTTLLQVARPWNCKKRRSGKSGSIHKSN
jgi:phage antirepressor YoqD-like protein